MMIESTEQIVSVETKDGPIAKARVWKGFTASGIPVQLLVTSIAVGARERQEEFGRELNAQHAPPPPAPAFSLRFVL